MISLASLPTASSGPPMMSICHNCIVPRLLPVPVIAAFASPHHRLNQAVAHQHPSRSSTTTAAAPPCDAPATTGGCAAPPQMRPPQLTDQRLDRRRRLHRIRPRRSGRSASPTRPAPPLGGASRHALTTAIPHTGPLRRRPLPRQHLDHRVIALLHDAQLHQYHPNLPRSVDNATSGHIHTP